MEYMDKQLYVSRYTYDRSGAQILDIIYCYQYCFNNNYEYIGAIKKSILEHLIYMTNIVQIQTYY